jgi:hypothetical protein
LNYYLIFTIVLVSTLPLAFGDQVSPHLRCDITEKQTWDEELQKHDCIPTNFVKPQSPTCKKDLYYWSYTENTVKKESTDYIWIQTGLQSYEQVSCHKAITKIEVNLDLWELWEQYAWDFVFSGRYGW